MTLRYYGLYFVRHYASKTTQTFHTGESHTNMYIGGIKNAVPVARKFAECIIVAVVTNAIAELRYQISRDFRRAGADKRRQCR